MGQGSVAISGEDTLVLSSGGRPIVVGDLADGDSSKVTFPDDLMMVKTGKNGNTIYALNENGRKAEMEVHVVRGSFTDKQLNSWLAELKSDVSKFILIDAYFTKRIGDGKGNITNDVYVLTGGVFKKQVEGKTSSEGDTEQSKAVYSLIFGTSDRSLQ